eukprot:1486939-Rhodomonas_salina.1
MDNALYYLKCKSDYAIESEHVLTVTARSDGTDSESTTDSDEQPDNDDGAAEARHTNSAGSLSG